MNPASGIPGLTIKDFEGDRLRSQNSTTVRLIPVALILFITMYYKAKEELVRKVGLLGLKDVKMLAPIGDLGYMNGWYPCSLFPGMGKFMNGGLERMIYEAAREQGYRFECISHNERGTDTVYYCKELKMTYHVDSSD